MYHFSLITTLAALSLCILCEGRQIPHPHKSIGRYCGASNTAFVSNRCVSLENKNSLSSERRYDRNRAASTVRSSGVSLQRSTKLHMSYLPPGGGNEKDKNFLTDISDALPGIGLAVGITLFFLSPLGGIFFAITNSLFVLALLTPFVLFAGFQLWTKLNTVQGECPSCSQPVVVLNSDDGAPSMCLSCGVAVRATKDKKSVELCSGTTMDDSFFDTDTGSSNGMDAFMDILKSNSSSEQEMKKEDVLKKATRERTVIDVDVDVQDD